MIEVDARTRKWGKSIGVVIPAEAAKQEGIGPDADVTLTLRRKAMPLEKIFGSIKLKKPVAKIMREIDEEMDFG
tara:strand:+ start:374 stop:595 length:222 start_codon:yes stop_codon:yes gene_type:complete